MTAGTQHDGPLPVTAEQWRAFLAEYSDWYLSKEPAHLNNLTEEQRRTRWLGREPASEQQIAATEERLGVRLPPSLRGFLLASDGWGPVSEWTDALSSCDEIDWFHNTHQAFVDAYRKAGGLEVDGEDDIFLHALSLAQGEDTILLDTRGVSAEGEYDAYLFAVKYGALPEPCTSFSEVIAEGRAEIEEC